MVGTPCPRGYVFVRSRRLPGFAPRRYHDRGR